MARKSRRSLPLSSFSRNARPKRLCRAPATLNDMVCNVQKKTIQHYRLEKRKPSITERNCSDDSGYEENDRNSFSSSPNPSLASSDDIINDENLLKSPIVARETRPSKKPTSVPLRPIFVSEADESDSDSSEDNADHAYNIRRGDRSAMKCVPDARKLEEEADSQVRNHSTKRMLMKEWMLYHLRSKTFPGMKWYNEEENLCQITWKHRSAGAWCREDVKHFESWASYTGRHDSDKDFKRWKANFRCALNILPDVQEVVSLRNSKGKNPYKVYRIDNQNRPKRHRSSCQSGSTTNCRTKKHHSSVSGESENHQEEDYTIRQNDLELKRAIEQLETIDQFRGEEACLDNITDNCLANIPTAVSMSFESISEDSYLSLSYAESNLQMPAAWSPPNDAICSLAGTLTEPVQSSLISSSSSSILPSVTTLLSSMSDPTTIYTETPTLDINQLPLLEYDSLLTPTTPEAILLNLTEADLFSLNCLPSQGELDRQDLTEMQNIFQSPFELPVSDPSSNSRLPLMIEAINAE